MERKYYRKKPVTIEAYQWFENGDHPDDFPTLMHDKEAREHGSEGDIVRFYRNPEDNENRVCQSCNYTMFKHGWIDTLEGGHVVCPGDYVIKGVNGEFYPCKEEIFWKTYESVDE